MNDEYPLAFAHPIGPWHKHFAWLPVDTVDQGTKWLRTVNRRRCQGKLDLPGPSDWFWQYSVVLKGGLIMSDAKIGGGMMASYFMFKNSRSIPDPTKKKILEREEYIDGPVRIMAEKEGYAMVRRKGCGPFVIRSTAIIRKEKHNDLPNNKSNN